MFEFQSGSIGAGDFPVAVMRDQGVVEGPFFPKLQTRVRRHAALITASLAVGLNSRRAHQRKHQGAFGHVIARKAAVEHRDASPPIAILDPVLGGKFLGGWPLDRAEGNLLDISTVSDRGRKQEAIADKFVVVQEFGSEVEARNSGVEPHAGGESSFAKSVLDREFGKDRSLMDYPSDH